MTTELPTGLAGLIKLLEGHFPLRSWPASVTLAEIHRHAGARDVVDYLRALEREATERHDD
jgi:hypothetical protein